MRSLAERSNSQPDGKHAIVLYVFARKLQL